MSVMELLRGTASTRAGRSGTAGDPTPPHHHLLAGAGTALASCAVVLLPALIAWVASPRSTVPWTDALGVGASLWLLGGGASLLVGSAPIAFVPLLLLALVVLGAAWAARRSTAATADAADTASHLGGLLAGSLLRALALWWGGYAACAAAWSLVAMTAAARPQVLTLAGPVLVVPLLAVVVAAVRHVAARPALAGPRWARPVWLPDWLRRAVRPAALGVAAMVAAGAGVVGVMVALRFEQVAHLHGELGPGITGTVLLTLAQVLALPNAGLWAVSFAAGTGVSVVEGASATWTGSRSGLMPMVPGLGALPEPGAFPGATPLVVLLPVTVGALIGWRSLRAVARLSTFRTKASVAGAAVVLAAAAAGLLDAVGGGSLGDGRLSDIGAPAPAMTVALLTEFALGAGLVLAWDRWRLRR